MLDRLQTPMQPDHDPTDYGGYALISGICATVNFMLMVGFVIQGDQRGALVALTIAFGASAACVMCLVKRSRER